MPRKIEIKESICPKCGNIHIKPGKFCSRKCSNSRTWTNEDKLKKSISAKNSQKVLLANIENAKNLKKKFEKFPKRDAEIELQCLSCGIFYSRKYRKKLSKYCSSKCNPKCGGYRPGSGRAKSGYYKGIYCGSTWELCWVIYNLDHQIKFSRFSEQLKSKELTYVPDFLLEDDKTIVEIKGFEDEESVAKKTQLAESFGYLVQVLRKKDLQKYFEYVYLMYGTDLVKLYDGYKPKYEYQCNFCKQFFSKDRKITTETKFCSRSCSGKFVAQSY